MAKKQKRELTVSELAAMGGRAASKSMTREQKTARAKVAAAARWNKAKNQAA